MQVNQGCASILGELRVRSRFIAKTSWFGQRDNISVGNQGTIDYSTNLNYLTNSYLSRKKFQPGFRERIEGTPGWPGNSGNVNSHSP